MFFKKFLKPKWQHKDPDTRRQAVEGMDPGEPQTQELLRRIAREDTHPQVRRAAVRRIQDLDWLQRLAQSDTDETVREQAGQQFGKLLSGEDPAAPSFEVRCDKLARLDQAPWIEYSARRGVEPQFRLQALARCDRESLFGDLAKEDPAPEVRIAAAERIAQRSTLERVYKQVRTRDKRVSKILQDKLEALRERQERPTKLLQQARQLCASLEGLEPKLRKDGQWQPAQRELERLKEEWETLTGQWDTAEYGSWDARLTERYHEACAQLATQIDDHRQQEAERRAREAEQAPIRTAKERACEGLETLDNELGQRGQPLDGDEDTVRQALEHGRRVWEQAGRLADDTQERTLATRFANAQQALEGWLKEINRHREGMDQARAIGEEATALLADSAPLQEKTVKALERRWREMDSPQRLRLAPSVQAECESALERLRQRRRDEVEASRQAMNQFGDAVEQLEQALERGKFKHGDDLQRRIKKLLKSLSSSDQAKLRRQGYYQRYQGALARLRELRDWKEWASVPVRERLCQEVETLADEVVAHRDDDQYDFREAAQSIGRYRRQWRKLGPPEEGADALIERFEAACERAHEPCRAFYERQNEQRRRNLEQKRELVEGLETYLASAVQDQAPEQVDWRGVEHTLNQARRQWREIGPAERKEQTELSERFGAALDGLRQALGEQRERNRLNKERLIRRAEQWAEGLEGDQDPDQAAVAEAVEGIKSLQQQWKEVGRAQGEKELWQRFRAAGDVVFSARDARKAQQREQRQQHLDAKVRLCKTVEALAELDDEPLVSSQGRFEQARQDWENIGPVPKSEEKVLNKRFREACQRFEQRLKDYHRAQRESQRNLLADKSQWCERLEALVEKVATGAMDPSDIPSPRQELARQWQGLEALEPDLERSMQARFQRAQDLLDRLVATDGADREALLGELERIQHENSEAKESLCLQMEILAGVESPPEAREARMALQVAQLAEYMQSGGTDAAEQQSGPTASHKVLELERQWYLTGPVSSERLEVLAPRFDGARDRFLSKEVTD